MNWESRFFQDFSFGQNWSNKVSKSAFLRMHVLQKFWFWHSLACFTRISSTVRSPSIAAVSIIFSFCQISAFLWCLAVFLWNCVDTKQERLLLERCYWWRAYATYSDKKSRDERRKKSCQGRMYIAFSPIWFDLHENEATHWLNFHVNICTLGSFSNYVDFSKKILL